jgi:SAM-dependent methyltransferase
MPRTRQRTLSPSWQPLGNALLDYQRGSRSTRLVVRSDLWEDERIEVGEYYRPDDREVTELERRALALCRGKVLDIGAGAGRHSLELQRSGLAATAVDLSPAAVSVMRQRGVRDARCCDVLDLDGERFDTLLLLMNGIGIVGTLRGLGRFLEHAQTILAAGGQILCDSADLSLELDQEMVDSLRGCTRRYMGEVSFSLVYGEDHGEPYSWLFVDPVSLATIAAAAGFDCEIVAHGQRGSYLARLTLP